MNLVLLALVPACFALNPVTGKALIDSFGAATLSLVRWSLSAAVIAVIALPRPVERWRAPPGHLLRVAVLGAMSMGFCAYAAFAAARTTEATNIGLIYGCTSAFVAAWEILNGRQRPTAGLLAGIAACLAGVVMILTRGHPGVLFDLTFAAGDLWAAAGMAVFVVYTVAMRRVPPVLTPLPQFAVMATAASLATLPFAAMEVARAGPPPVGVAELPWLAAMVIGTGIGAFLGYNISLSRNGPVLTSASLALTPVFAAGMAMVLIGERLGWYHAVALVLVVGGLMSVNRSQHAKYAK